MRDEAIMSTEMHSNSAGDSMVNPVTPVDALAPGPRALRRLGAVAALAAVALLAACDDEVAPPFSIEGTGSVEGLVFFDASEDRVFDPADGDYAVSGVAVAVLERGTGETFAGGTATSGDDGRFRVEGLPAGTHDLLIDESTVPEGINICQNPLPVTVYLDETQFRPVQGRPGCLITIEEAKEADVGEFVIVEGIVTSFPGQIESNFVYIEDETAGLFLFAPGLMGQGIEVGDLIEVGGSTALFSGQFQLGDDTQLRRHVEDVETPEPTVVTTAEIAASGSDPLHDLQNRLVKLEAAELTAEFGAPGNEQNAFIDDGTGQLIMRVDDGVVSDRDSLNSMFSVGTCYDIVGFAANFNGTGQIFPRSLDDIEEVPCG